MNKIYKNIKQLRISQTKMSQFATKQELRAIQKWIERENKKGKIYKYHVSEDLIFITRIK